MKFTQIIEFDWDKGNSEKSWKKHKIKQSESEEIFFQKPLLLFPDLKHSEKEHRFIAMGRTKRGKLLFVAYTERVHKIRIISTRRQSKKERKTYEKEL